MLTLSQTSYLSPNTTRLLMKTQIHKEYSHSRVTAVTEALHYLLVTKAHRSSCASMAKVKIL